MSTHPSRTWLAAGVLLIAGAAVLVGRAGPLDPPPGAIAPTYRTLGEVEPRTPVGPSTTPGDALALFVISQPGSYYLTDNIQGVAGKDGIRITAPNVTLDLNGFTLRGVPGSVSGVRSTAGRFALCNGHVTEWGNAGIAGLGDFLLSDLQVNLNGGGGIQLSSQGVITRCRVWSNTGTGIQAGFGVAISDCAISDNTVNGVQTGSLGVVTGCTSTGNGGDGFSITADSVVTRCLAAYNGGDGFDIALAVHIRDCEASNNGGGPAIGAGIRVSGGNCRVEANNVALNDRGILALGPTNIILRNSASGNAVNYEVGAGNTMGPVVTAADIATNTNPHANYEY